MVFRQCALCFHAAVDFLCIIFHEVVINLYERLAAVFQAKESIPDFIGRDKAVALHDFLIMPRDTCTEFVEHPVDFPCRYTLTNRTTTLDAPEVQFDGYLAAELRLCAVHGDASHNGCRTVFLYLVFLQIEDD